MKQTKGKIKSNGKLWVALAILVLAVLLCGIITQGFSDFNPYCWFGHKYDKQDVCARCGAEKPAEELEQANGNVVLTPIVSQGIQLYSAPAVAAADEEQSYMLTATITPASADDKRVEWSVAWKNANSLWAIGKTVTEYVTVTPSADNALTATVACIKDFGEQVIVTVKSLDNEEATATCTVDYVRRILDVTVNIPAIASLTTPFTYDITYSNYTIAGELEASEVERQLYRYDELYEAFYDLGTFDNRGEGDDTIANHIQVNEIDYFDLDVDTPVIILNEFNTSFGTFFDYGVLSAFIAITQDLDFNYDKGNLIRAFRECMDNYTNDICLHWEFSIVYNGKSYSYYDVETYCEFDTSALHIAVNNVNMSQGSLVF